MTAKTSPETLSQRVVQNARRLRKLRGWSARELAERLTASGCPVSRVVIANRECGQNCRTSVDELFALAEVLGCSVDDLVAEQAQCPRCAGSPPVGYLCGLCGASGDNVPSGAARRE